MSSDSLTRQFPLKYTSSILISFLDLGPTFTPSPLWATEFQIKSGLGSAN